MTNEINNETNNLNNSEINNLNNSEINNLNNSEIKNAINEILKEKAKSDLELKVIGLEDQLNELTSRFNELYETLSKTLKPGEPTHRVLAGEIPNIVIKNYSMM